MDEEQVRKITEQLLQVIQKSAQRFERTKKEGLEYDFFTEIKPSVDKILPILDEWEIVAKKWINKYHPRYLHSQQIDTAKEHIENIVIQSFFQDTSKVRFKNIKESAEYTLRSMIREMEKNE
ncbi:YppE family protein [Aeribacillus composti]|uniref:YppE family protein n=1 Tax=Aeribacillus composti TaxID=1868734 RepID=UPI003D191FE1